MRWLLKAKRSLALASLVAGWSSSTETLVASLSPTSNENGALDLLPSHRLLKLIERNRSNTPRKAIPLVGIHDALSARILSNHGAEALFVSGFGVSASRLGQPDAGILTRSDLEQTVQQIQSSLGARCAGTSSEDETNNENLTMPPLLLVDCDTGFGGAINLIQTIRNLARIGVAAVSIEDQMFPKRCTYVAGKKVTVVSREEAVDRVRTAVMACINPVTKEKDILLIARTDCRMALGLEEALTRCQEFEKLGADIVYAENLQSPSEYEMLRAALKPETICMLAQVQQLSNDNENEAERTLYNINDIGSMGFDLGLFGVTALQATVQALEATSREFFQNQGLVNPTNLASLEKVKSTVGFPELDELLEDYDCQ